MPGIRRSRIRQAVSAADFESRNSSADANASARNPEERRSLRVDRRTETSSSTIETTMSSGIFFPFISSSSARTFMPHYNRTPYENSTVPWYRPNKGMRVSSVEVVIAEMRSCLGAGGASALDRALRRDRQADQERCSWPLVWLGPQPAAMRLNDGARDGQSHTHPVGFSGVKRLKQPLHLSRFETRARILHAKAGLRYSIAYLATPADYQDAFRFLGCVHRIHSIDDQIEENLLELHTVSKNGWKVLGQLSADRCLTRSALVPGKRADIRNDIP